MVFPWLLQNGVCRLSAKRITFCLTQFINVRWLWEGSLCLWTHCVSSVITKSWQILNLNDRYMGLHCTVSSAFYVHLRRFWVICKLFNWCRKRQTQQCKREKRPEARKIAYQVGSRLAMCAHQSSPGTTWEMLWHQGRSCASVSPSLSLYLPSWMEKQPRMMKLSSHKPSAIGGIISETFKCCCLGMRAPAIAEPAVYVHPIHEPPGLSAGTTW